MKILYFLSLTLCLNQIATQFDSTITACTNNCPNGCSTCEGSDCITCSPGFSLSQSTCQPIPCLISGCSLCSSQGMCLLCSDPYHHFNDISGVCQQSCPLQNCQKCKQQSSKCDLCSQGFWLYAWDGSCHPSPIKHCLEGYDWRRKDYQCIRCQSGYRPTMDQLQCIKDQCRDILNCQKCSNDSYCQLCRQGFAYLEQQCRPNNCMISNCLTCSLSGECLKCSSGFTLKDNQCTETQCSLENCQKCKPNSKFCDLCQPPYIYNIWSQVCQKIQTSPSGLHCESVDRRGKYYTCLTCLDGYTFTNTNKVACQKQCPSNCLQCQSSTICQQCQSGYTLVGSQCNKNICEVDGCQICTTEGSCIKCLNDYQRYVEDQKKCLEKCQLSHCQRCKIGSSQCQLCDQGYSLSEWTNSCIRGSIENCLKVHDWRGQEYRCSRCVDGYTPAKDNTLCSVNTCPSITNCLKCTNSSICDICLSGYYLFDGICLKNKCEVQYCLQCNQEGTCIKPISSHYLVGQIPTPKNCQLTNCLICKPDSSFCDICQNGYEMDFWSNTCFGLSQEPVVEQTQSNLKYLWLLLLLVGVIAVIIVIKLTRLQKEEQVKEAQKHKKEEEEKKKKMVIIDNPPMLHVIKNSSLIERCSEASSEDHPSIKLSKVIKPKAFPPMIEPSQIQVSVPEDNEPLPFSPIAQTNDRIIPQQSLRSELSGELSEASIHLPALKVRGLKKSSIKKEEPFVQ